MAADQTGDGRDVDDRAAAALEQRQRVFAAEKRAVEIDRHHPPPGGEIGVLDRADGDDACRIHQAVKPPARFGDHSRHAVPIAFRGDVERVADVAAAGKIAPDRRAALGLDRLHNGGADGARGAGHQYDFVLQPGHGTPSRVDGH